ncbi:hypothetical protein AB0J84_18975 [Micromonospora arborensis]|uniref:hypothetical protein n=1 Tax=Micromonospora arborensis TaxID=2116518 RepID=UPI003433F771
MTLLDAWRGAANTGHLCPRGRRAAAAAAVWSLAYALAGLWWAFGGPGYPFGESARAATMGAVLVGLNPAITGAAIATLGLTGVLVAAGIRAPIRSPRGRPLLRGFAWSAALTLLLVVPDGRALLSIGELLMLHVDRVEGAAIHQLFCAFGGLLWIYTASATHRTSLPGTRHDPRWGRRITWIAAALPLLYTVPRLLWALGFTFGLDTQTTAMVSDPVGRTRELVFGAAACAGGLLTLGLTYRWGERLPAAVPLLGGRRVPISLATIPAGLVSLALTGAGFTMWRMLAAGLLGPRVDDVAFNPDNWAAWLGNLAWLPWGVALGLATNAYRRRRKADRPKPLPSTASAECDT